MACASASRVGRTWLSLVLGVAVVGLAVAFALRPEASPRGAPLERTARTPRTTDAPVRLAGRAPDPDAGAGEAGRLRTEETSSRDEREADAPSDGIAGTLVLSDGTGVAAFVPVRAVRQGDAASEAMEARARWARADASGDFELEGLPPGTYLVSVPGNRAPAVVATPGGELLRIVVEVTRYHVRVLGEDDQPIPARIVAERITWGPGCVRSSACEAKGGVATLAAAAGARVAFGAATVDGAFGETEVETPGGEGTREVVVRPRRAEGPPGSIRLLLEGEDGTLLRAARVFLRTPLTGLLVKDLGDASAGGVLRPVPPGRWEVRVGRPFESGDPARTCWFTARGTVEVRPGVPEDLRLLARAGARLELRVDSAFPDDDSSHFPYASARRVEVADAAAKTSLWPDWGVDELSEVLEPGTYRVEVEAAGHETATREIDLPVGRVTRLEVTLDPE